MLRSARFVNFLCALCISAGLLLPEKIVNGQSATAGATKVNPKDALTYVWIPPGKFMMGCSPGDTACSDDEKPAHPVVITRGFWMGQTLVTQGAYQRVRGTNPSYFHGDQLPVESVTWDEARGYCAAAGMRLPTEAEWEYAARAGTTEAPYGDLDAIAWYANLSRGRYIERLKAGGGGTKAVALKQPNAWKLYDTLGNVWEWTADWYDEKYYARGESRDPAGTSSGKYRVLRGASWANEAGSIRVSNRGRNCTGSA